MNLDISVEEYKLDSNAYIKYLATEQKRFDIYDSNIDDIKDNLKSKPMKAIIFVTFILVLILGSIIAYKLVIHKLVIESTSYHNEIDGVDIIFDSEKDYIQYNDNIEYNLSQLPEFIKERFKADKWKIYITNEEMAESGLYWGLKDKSDIVGATSVIYKYIIIPNNDRSINMSVVHEMGHYIDKFKYTYTNEWKQIYLKECDNYLREYARTNRIEAFACEFMEFIQTPEELKEKAPQTYKYIENIVNELKK